MDSGAHVNLQNEVPTKTLQAWMCVYMVLYFIMQKGGSALMIACSKGHTAIVQLLLENDANTNLQALVCLLNSINFACKPMSIL